MTSTSITSITSSNPTNQSTEMKLEQQAKSLLRGFNQPIKRQLRGNSRDKVKELLWDHLEESLRDKFAGASNLNKVLASTKKRLEEAIDLEAEKNNQK